VFINTIRNKCKGITAILMYLNKAWIDEKSDPPQPPLKRGAFRLTVMCKGIYLDPPQPPLKKGAFRLTVMCKNIYIVNSVNV